jgi:hypothetical protein
MNYDDYIEQAINHISAWDLSEEELPDAINQQARLLAGIDWDTGDTQLSLQVYTALRF